MANPEHLAILKKGVKAWNLWQDEHPEISPDLSFADLAGMNLGWANFVGANFDGAKLSRATLTAADFSQASLREADLDGADLTAARVAFTIFAHDDLSAVRGLDAVDHIGPSSIDINTIYDSKGKIPHLFLRGAGVPENFIQHMASLVGTGIEFYSLFISYSHKDEEFAKRLHADLQATGVRCWYAPEDMPGGKKLHDEIDTAIRMHDKALLILSEHSMVSKWVKTEMRRARKRELEEGRRVLFPICICPFEKVSKWVCFYADEGIDLAEEIREYFIPDFSNWKDHDAYKRAFDRLLKDLQGKADSSSA